MVRLKNLGLRDLYNKYIHPEVIDTTDKRIWEHLAAGDVMDVFQFSLVLVWRLRKS